MPGIDPMKEPASSPLGGLNPADLLRQGVAEDTRVDVPPFTPPPMEELAPLFPRFEFIELVGTGGMGAVYKVRQRELDRVVALKILPPTVGDTPGFSDRFAREAKALARLDHSGIVTVHEFGQADGLCYIVMEYVDGVNLRQLMQRGRISPREALVIVPAICDALQFAHDQGIVHRDIKPENILLDRRGRVKVADFGIAKLMGSEEMGAQGIVLSGAESTVAGQVMGTPQYMAPEQMDNSSGVDHRADIYALGVVFYQMLTGELPGGKIENPSSKVKIDVRLDEIVLQALQKDPNLRYQQAETFKTQVETVAAHSTAMEEKGAKSKTRHSKEKEHEHGWLSGGWGLVPVVAILLAFFNPWGGKAWIVFAGGCALLPFVSHWFQGNRKARIGVSSVVLLVVVGSMLAKAMTRPDIQRAGEKSAVAANETKELPVAEIGDEVKIHNEPGNQASNESAPPAEPQVAAAQEVVPSSQDAAPTLTVSTEVEEEPTKEDTGVPMPKNLTIEQMIAAQNFVNAYVDMKMLEKSDLGENHPDRIEWMKKYRELLGNPPEMARENWDTLTKVKLEDLAKERERLLKSGLGAQHPTVARLQDVMLIVEKLGSELSPETNDSSTHQDADKRSLADQWIDLQLKKMKSHRMYLKTHPARIAAEKELSDFEAKHADFPNKESKKLVFARKLKLQEERSKLLTEVGAEHPSILELNNKISALDELPQVGRKEMAPMDAKNLPEGNIFQIRLVSPDDPEAEAVIYQPKRGGGDTKESLLLSHEVIVWDEHVAGTNLSGAEEGFRVEIQLNDAGARRLSDATAKMKFGSDRLAILDRGVILVAPVIQVQLGKSFQIAGFDSKDKAVEFLRSFPGWEKQTAAAGAMDWLMQIDKAEYVESYSQLADIAKSAMTETQWVELMTRLRTPLGSCLSRSVLDMQEMTALPGMPDGKYRIVTVRSVFANKESAVETVSFISDKNEEWKPAGYFIR